MSSDLSDLEQKKHMTYYIFFALRTNKEDLLDEMDQESNLLQVMGDSIKREESELVELQISSSVLECNETPNSLISLENDVRSKEEVISSLEQRIEKYAQIEAEIKNKEKELDLVKSKIREFTSKLELLQSNLTKTEVELKNRELEISSLREEKTVVLASLEEKVNAVKQLDQLLKEKENSISGLLEKNTHLESKLEETESINVELKTKTAEISSVTKKQSALESLIYGFLDD